MRRKSGPSGHLRLIEGCCETVFLASLMAQQTCVATQVAAQLATDSAAKPAEPDRDSSPPAPTQANPLRARERRGGGQEHTERQDGGGGRIDALFARSAAAC